MTDLNLTYGTVTDGGSLAGHTFTNPSYANDGSLSTFAVRNAFVTSGTVLTILKSDLGTARAVSGAEIYYKLPTYRFDSLEYSADGTAWTNSGATATAIGADLESWSIGSAITARYWRLKDTSTGGLRYIDYLQVKTWTLEAGTVIPAPPGVYVDWDDDGFGGTASIDWITGDVRSWRITRGASPELTGGATIGQAVITLANPQADDRYNPENTSGTLYGKLRDGVPVWIGVDADGRVGAAGTAAYGLFGGRVVDVTPLLEPGAAKAPLVEITAEDDLARLGRVDVDVSDSLTRSHGDLRAAVLTAATIYNQDLGPEVETMPLSSASGRALEILDRLNAATGTRHFVKPGATPSAWFSYTARDRQWGLSGTASASLGTADHVQSVSGWRKSADTVVNRQRVAFTPVTFTPGQVTVWEHESLPLVVSGTATIWVDFDDFVDSPTIDINYSGTAPTTSIDSFGDRAKLTITSGGTTTVTGLSVEGRLARRANQQLYQADNATSQADPRGVRSGNDITSEFVGVLASARGLAEHVVWRFGSPQVRPTLTVHNWMPEQFSLDLFDVISVDVAQIGVTGRLFEIVGLTHEGHRASSTVVHHSTTYVLQECRVQTATDWFQADIDAADGTAILGY